MNLREEVRIFGEKLSIEGQETKEAVLILQKYLQGKELTEEEEKAFREQFYDVLKIAGLGIPFTVVPGASVLIPLVVAFMKKKGVNLLPSAFDEKEA